MRAGGTVPVSYTLMTSCVVKPRPFTVASNAMEDGYTEEETISKNFINSEQYDCRQEIICISTPCVK